MCLFFAFSCCSDLCSTCVGRHPHTEQHLFLVNGISGRRVVPNSETSTFAAVAASAAAAPAAAASAGSAAAAAAAAASAVLPFRVSAAIDFGM
jgi:hypothetical protein